MCRWDNLIFSHSKHVVQYMARSPYDRPLNLMLKLPSVHCYFRTERDENNLILFLFTSPSAGSSPVIQPLSFATGFSTCKNNRRTKMKRESLTRFPLLYKN